jgi:GNAT superfamily N-acetyltransferase
VTDIDQMHRIRMRVRENALSDPQSVRPEHYATMLTERGAGWIAEIDGEIVGFAVADLILASVWALFVDPSCEGRGVGRRLHDTMMNWIFDNGTAVVRLSTTPRTRAERFYEAAGWKVAADRADGEVCYELTRQEWTRRGKA